MFSSIKVENFKVFSSLSVDKLSRVNVFFGSNNCGKSTFQEAVFLLTGDANPELLLKCNQFRSFRKIEDFSYFFHNTSTAFPIKISSLGDSLAFNRDLTIQLDENTPLRFKLDDSSKIDVTNEKSHIGISLKQKIGDELVESYFAIRKQGKKETGEIQLSQNRRNSVMCFYMPPVYSLTTILDALREIVKSKQKDDFIAALQVIDERVKNFEITDSDIMIDVGFDKLIPLSFIGDGVRKFFAIITHLYSSSNGILVIDEIDNGLHYSAMKKLWEIVLKLSRKYNVQVFASTHNIDSLQGLCSFLANETSEQNQISLYKLLRKDIECNSALQYDYEEFRFMLERENEIR